jgi:outer membrane lipopolysaccharide assembly protein LptE/RlpB
MRVLKTVLVGLVLCLGPMMTACGSPPSTPAKSAEAPPEMASLTIALSAEPGTPPEIVSGVETSLARAGFSVVTGSEGDVQGTLRVQRTEEKGFMTVFRNGQKVVNYSNVVTLQLRDGDQIVEVATAQFTAEAGEVDAEKLEDIARKLSSSASLRRISREKSQATAAADQEARQAEAEEAEREAAEAESAKQREDNVAWVKADARGCKSPTKLDACKGVQLYLAEHPEGLHADEAGAVLAEAKPKLDALQKDEDRWQQTGSAACVPGAAPEACEGVELYLVVFPAGMHSVEAHEILREAGRE